LPYSRAREPADSGSAQNRATPRGGKEPVRIVCIGDSITGVYYHSGGLRAYPEMLQIALQKIHPQAQLTVRNAGISGDTTTGGLKRLDRDVLAHKPHLVTVMFGMNDLVRTPVADFQNNLRRNHPPLPRHRRRGHPLHAKLHRRNPAASRSQTR
jgi:lysophospholipase L1-like esterase